MAIIAAYCHKFLLQVLGKLSRNSNLIFQHMWIFFYNVLDPLMNIIILYTQQQADAVQFTFLCKSVAQYLHLTSTEMR